MGRVDEAGMPFWPDVDEDPARYLDVFGAEALDALRGVPKPDPKRADRRLLWASDTTPLCHFGIFNPMGPTRNSLELAADQTGRHHLVHMMRHPFASEYEVLGPVETDGDLRELISSALPDRLGSLPEFLWITAPENFEGVVTRAMWDLFLAVADENDTALALTAAELWQYGGRAWDRLNKTDSVPADRVPVHRSAQRDVLPSAWAWSRV